MNHFYRAGRGTLPGALRSLSVGLAFWLAPLFCVPLEAANYVFDIQYFGDDVSLVAPGSQDPTGVTLSPGDTFQWTIAAQDNHYWRVDAAVDFFALMAFTVDPDGLRTGDFSLALRNNGADVLNLMQSNEPTSEVHIGTNGVLLPLGLEFDEMFLDYLLVDSVELLENAADPDNLMQVDTTIQGLLPVLGMPENNEFSPGVVYVPEPGALALITLAALACVAGRRR
ncbi:hypothetical protein Pla175_05620 [Pirellulimonas nuda]|uniref:Ice-binding protein C-terminal domain-containing protein n=1 Tax=Pirellulimonas nuda TaxID=2528009 RepID=A0A518D6X1_9BACT|nr:PEP-CTERM sorting domain-containing protein [Pirellulimonas nuda]QDU87205.1 hypothetical protein Pla175_05620 [Pirellulimonas nuda]